MAAVIPFLLLLFSLLFSWMLAASQPTMIFLTFGGVGLTAAVFLLNETLLPIALILTLALGSAYDYNIMVKSFYIRFAVLALIAVRSFLLAMQLKLQRDFPRFPITWVHAAFLYTGFFGLLTSVYSVAVGVSAQRAASFLLLYIVAFYYFWNRVSTAERSKKLAESMWWALVFIIGVGYLFLLARNPEMYKVGRLRLLLGNPNQLAHYCAIMAPIAFWYWQERAEGIRKKMAAVVMALIALSLILSGSRGGLLSAIGALFLLFILCYRKRLAVFLFLIVLAVTVHFFISKNEGANSQDPSFFQETILREGELSSGSGRTDVWKAAVRLIKRAPFFGYGFGAVEPMFDKGYFPELPNFQGGHVHNSYLEELVNLGWVGVFPMFLALAYVLISGMLSISKYQTVTPEFRFFCALYASIIAACISGVFESWFTSVGSIFCFPFWLIVSLMLKMNFHFRNWTGATT